MRRIGFHNAEYFVPFRDGTGCELAEYVRDIHDENPNSRIMLVGWSFGSIFVKDAMTRLDAECDYIDTVVYIDSTALKLCEWTGHPENYDRAVLIYRSNQSPPCCCFVDPEILCVSSWLHLSVPHDKCTVDQLIAEAIRLADN